MTASASGVVATQRTQERVSLVNMMAIVRTQRSISGPAQIEGKDI